MSIFEALPEFCEQAGWTIAGFDVLSKHRGHVTLVAFMPLNCIDSDARLQNFQKLRETDDDVHVLVVSPSDTFYDTGVEKRRKYTNIKFWIDSKYSSAWNQTDANNYDYFIYDKCGKLNDVLRSPQTDIARFDEIVNKIKQLKRRSRCGRCVYDRLQSGKNTDSSFGRNSQNADYEKIRIHSVNEQLQRQSNGNHHNIYHGKITQKIPIQQTVFVPYGKGRQTRKETVRNSAKTHSLSVTENIRTDNGQSSQYGVDRSSTYSKEQNPRLGKQHTTENQKNGGRAKFQKQILSSSNGIDRNLDLNANEDYIRSSPGNVDHPGQNYYSDRFSNPSKNRDTGLRQKYNIDSADNFERNKIPEQAQNESYRISNLSIFGRNQNFAAKQKYNINDFSNFSKGAQFDSVYYRNSSSAFNTEGSLKSKKEYYKDNSHLSDRELNQKPVQNHYRVGFQERTNRQKPNLNNQHSTHNAYTSNKNQAPSIAQESHAGVSHNYDIEEDSKAVKSHYNKNSGNYSETLDSKTDAQYSASHFYGNSPGSHEFNEKKQKLSANYGNFTSVNHFQMTNLPDYSRDQAVRLSHQRYNNEQNHGISGRQNARQFSTNDGSKNNEAPISSDHEDVLTSLYNVGNVADSADEESEAKMNSATLQQDGTLAVSRSRTPLPNSYRSEDVVFCDHRKNKEDGTMWWRRCCTKGVYLTDVCVPGRCSNSTAQLCCAQKFLQARYRCCRNETLNAIRPTDSFSRCCYNNFVDKKDQCCSYSEARSYWLSNAELCLPNVFVNLTDVVLQARISDTEQVVVRLSEDKSWTYLCTYGTNVMQFIYLPDFTHD